MRTLHLARRDSNLRETFMFSPFSSCEAALLRRSIDQCTSVDNTEPEKFSTYVCLSGRDGEAQMNEITTLLSQVYLETVSHLRYIPLIYAEPLSVDAQRNLKSLKNCPGVVFALVANRITTVDKVVLDRCVHRLYLGSPSFEPLCSLVEAVLLSNNVAPTDALTDRILTTLFKSYAEFYVLIMTEVISVQVAAHSDPRNAD